MGLGFRLRVHFANSLLWLKLNFDQVLGDRPTANMADADRLTYLKLCIRETLRL